MTREEQLQQQNRSRLYNDLSNFIEESEIRNAEYYPDRYEEFVDSKTVSNLQDLQKINIEEFLREPTHEVDYGKLKKRMKDYDQKIEGMNG